MHCLPSLLNIMFLCLVEVPISTKNNTKIFKVSTDVNFATDTHFKIDLWIKTAVFPLPVIFDGLQ